MAAADGAWAVVGARRAGGDHLVLGRLIGPCPGLEVLDALARLHLVTRRRGWTIELAAVHPQLRELLEVVGLAELLLEAGGEAEGGEQLGIEEVVPRGDPPA